MNLHIIFSKKNLFRKSVKLKYEDKEFILFKNILYSLKIKDFQNDFIEIEYHGRFYEYSLKELNAKDNDNIIIELGGFDLTFFYGDAEGAIYIFILFIPIFLLFYIFKRKAFITVSKISDEQLQFAKQIFLE